MDIGILIPLGVIGLIRWTCWLAIRIPAALYRPVRDTHMEAMTVVTPVYMEDPAIFAAAIESWLANGCPVICVVDVTDGVCIEVAHRYPVQIILTDVPGKRDALRKGWEAARTPLVALVDSDTIWARDVAYESSKPFADQAVGGVGTRQNVYNPSSIWEKLNDAYLDYRYYDENAAQTVMGRAVSCLSGRTAIYRRELLLEISDEFMDETFLGTPCNSGDDKRLTTLILERGNLTVMQRSARVWSTFPDNARGFYRQRLRWSRNTWRSDLRALGRRWVFRYPFLAFTMINKVIGCFTLLLSPIMMLWALVTGRFAFAAVLALWWLVSRSVKLLPHLERRPGHVVLMPFFIAMSFVMVIVKIAGLVTIRQHKWLTRPVAVIDGELVRTETAA